MKYTIVPGSKKQVLIHLHGTGGASADLFGLGQMILSDATLVGIDGDVFENGMRRYFARYADGTFDMESFKENTYRLYKTINDVITKEQLDGANISILGYSNGANILLNLMREYDDNKFHNVLLFHPSSTRESDPYIQKGINVFMTRGAQDPFITKDAFKQIQKALKDADNTVKTHEHDFGHQLLHEEVSTAQKFMEKMQD